MTSIEFEDYLSEAMSELREKQAALESGYGFGSHARWHFDQQTGKLAFFDASDAKTIEADVIQLGSFSPYSDSWNWAWANDSVPPAHRELSEPLKELAGLTGIDLFESAEPFVVGDESTAWRLAALGLRHLGALGVYRVPASSRLIVFLALTSLRKFAS